MNKENLELEEFPDDNEKIENDDEDENEDDENCDCWDITEDIPAIIILSTIFILMLSFLTRLLSMRFFYF